MTRQRAVTAILAPMFLMIGFLSAAVTGGSSSIGKNHEVSGGLPGNPSMLDTGVSMAADGAFQVQPGRAAQPAPGQPAILSYKGRDIPNTIDEILSPKHTALVVHEMLNTFISAGGSYDKAGRRYDLGRMARILPPITKLLATARAKNVRVVYLRYTSTPDGSSASDPQIRSSFARSGQPPPPAGDVGTVDGSWGWQNIDEVKPAPGDWIVRKYRPNGFFQTPLDALLRWNGIKTFVMVGIGGEVGYLPTMETASEIGYFTVAVEDGVLSSNASRQEALMPFIADHAMMMKSAELIDIWNKH